MPRLQNVTTEEIETIVDVLNMHGSDAYAMAEKIEKGYVSSLNPEDIELRVRYLLSAIGGATKLAHVLACRAEIARGRQQLAALTPTLNTTTETQAG